MACSDQVDSKDTKKRIKDTKQKVPANEEFIISGYRFLETQD